MESLLLVQVAVGNEEQATLIGRAVVESGLVACTQMVPIRSCYRWKGEIVEEHEWLLLMKTTASAYEQIEQLVKELHSYEIPEILAFPIVRGLPAYLEWVTQVVHPRQGT